MSRAFKFGDGISTDLLAPGNLLKLPPTELADHCLNAVDPDFAGSVQQGDILLAGKNFGQGSSREQAVVSLKLLGISAVLASSFARIFYRNAINLGLPVFIFENSADFETGANIELDMIEGTLTNHDTGQAYPVRPLPDHVMEIVTLGGLIPFLARRFQAGR